MPVGALQQMAAPEQQGAEGQPAAPAAPAEQQRDFIAEYNEKLRQDRSVLDNQINALKSRLIQRTALPFDPNLMAVAAAAGKPTKTGHFAESASNIAGEMQRQALEQQTKGLDLMKFEKELAEKQYELNRGDAKDALINSFLASKGLIPGGAPAGSAGPRLVGAPAGGAPAGAAPSGGAAPAGEPAPSGRRITPEEIALIGSKNKELGDFLSKISKLQQDAIMVVDNGVFNTLTNEWLIAPNKTLERDLPKIALGDGRTLDVGKKVIPADLSKKIDAIQNDQNLTTDQRNAKLLEFYDRYGLIDFEASPTTGKKTIVTPQEKAEKAELTKADIEAIVKEKAKMADRFTSLAETAPTLRQVGNQNIDLIKQPEVRALMDKINANGEFSARFSDLIAEGLTTPGGSIAAPGYKKFMMLIGVQPNQISAFNQLLSNSNQIALTASKEFLSGQGAVTENERKLVAQIGPDVFTNTPANLAFKSQVMVARSKFLEMQEQMYNEWRRDPANQRKYASEFKSHGPYKKMVNDYDNWFSATSRNFYPALGAGKSSAATAPSASQPSGGSLEAKIRQQAEQ